MSQGVILLPSVCGYHANSYLIYADGEAALTDPCLPQAEVEAVLAAHALQLRYILLTHAHYDHVVALYDSDFFAALPVCIHSADAPALANRDHLVANLFGETRQLPQRELHLLADGDRLPLGNTQLTVYHTPGHTPGSVCYGLGDVWLTGDTLFADSIGATRFAGGDMFVLFSSLRKIMRLAPRHIYPGHGPDAAMEEVYNQNPYLHK